MCFQKTKDDFDNHKRICKGKIPKMSFDKKEFQSLKNRMNDLDSTLKICTFNMKKLNAMFPKGKIQGKHTSQAHTKHDHNAQHNHAYIYGKVYTYTHCGRKIFFAKFCYAKLNLKNKNVWVRETNNPVDPKRFGFKKTQRI